MILLDTDHLSVFTNERDPRHAELNRRMEAADDNIACTIVSLEEMLRGWLAVIHQMRDIHRQISAYARLGQIVEVFSQWPIQKFEKRAADQFAALRRQRIRISSMDLKIASIALSTGALLVSGNIRDFSVIPGLRIENWLR
jgi:tRNA(fMet)-specific endonuclease VapC